MSSYRSDLLLLPNPVDCRSFRFRLHSPAAARLVWVRAFHRIYNPPLAVQVLAHITASHPSATLRMVGPDKGDGSLQETVRTAGELGVEKRLTIIPGVPLSQVPDHLRTGDIFLNTSNIDNVPVSVLQAMSAGLCVVSTDAGGMRYLLENQRDSFLVPSADVDAMAAAVERILGDPITAAALSLNARLKAEQCDWPLYLARWKELLLSLARAAPVSFSNPQSPAGIPL
jgi:glycosyltransferase involved in cell wall biosynthesis